MKYKKENYESVQLYECCRDMSESNHTQKFVKVRKNHKCCDCKKEINKSEYAIRETVIIQGEGFKSCYTCIPCADNYMNDLGY